MILEHSILAALYILGVCYQVMQEIGKQRKKYPAYRPGQLFGTYWQEEWNTLIVSALGLVTLQLFGLIAHIKNIPLPVWLHDWGVYALTPVAGYGWHRIVYSWLGTTEKRLTEYMENKTGGGDKV